jgi:glycosyltransferase involved in cell wall biosynthesis
MKVAILTTDSREHFQQYDRATPYFGSAPQALLEGMAQLAGLEVHVVSCLQRPTRSPAKLADNLWYHGLHVPKLGWMRTGYQGCVQATRRKLRELNPQIVHGQGTERDCALSAVRSGFPNVVTIHGNMRRLAALSGAKPFSFSWLAARLEGWVLPRTDGVICPSQHTRREVQALARRTWVAPNAVDPRFFAVRNVPTHPPLLVCVATVNPNKNQNLLIRALDPLVSRTPFKLVFLGMASKGDPYGAQFLDLLESRPWCEHRGFADRETLRASLAQATALVLPSLEENCPMAVLEAMAAGVPVAAARVGGVPELLEDGVNGFLFDPQDPEQIRNSIGRVLGDKGFARQMAAQARQRAWELFRPEVIARRHVEIYQEVLSKLS